MMLLELLLPLIASGNSFSALVQNIPFFWKVFLQLSARRSNFLFCLWKVFLRILFTLKLSLNFARKVFLRSITTGSGAQTSSLFGKSSWNLTSCKLLKLPLILNLMCLVWIECWIRLDDDQMFSLARLSAYKNSIFFDSLIKIQFFILNLKMANLVTCCMFD